MENTTPQETAKGETALGFKVATTANVTRKSVAYLLCSAFEGGSNYWYQIHDYVEPQSLTFRFDKGEVYEAYDYPLNDGGAVLVGDSEEPDDEPKRLDLAAIERGLQVMAEKYPRHWQDFANENDDACTGDVFLQCCLFGEIVYG
jgi:hypothetical protein